jgi:hypothetical protein
MSMIQKRNGNRRKPRGFRPTQDFINQAVTEYLANGGTITKLHPEPNRPDYLPNSAIQVEVDDFLRS